MKNLKPFFFVAMLVGLISSQVLQSNAQSANTNQIGLRLGRFSGISFSHVGSKNVGVEADLLANYQVDWAMISVLAEKHIPLRQGFVFCFGGGGFFAGDHNYPYPPDEPYNWKSTIGIEGMLGFDYYFKDVPLNAGIDLRPRFSFFAEPYWPWDVAISLHYVF